MSMMFIYFCLNTETQYYDYVKSVSLIMKSPRITNNLKQTQ